MADFVVHDDLPDFWATAEALFTVDPVRHTVALTALTRRLDHPDHDGPREILVTAYENGELRGAAVQMPPYPLLSTAIPVDLVDEFAAVVRRLVPNLGGVNGDRESAEAFAAAWQRLTSSEVTEAMALRLHRLGTLVVPAVPGVLRLATPDDAELLGPWYSAFMAEAMDHITRDEDADPVAEVREQIVRGHAHAVWEVDGVPVSWAAASPPVRAMSRIGPVYTPAQHRGHGYAAAVTAGISTWARSAGADEVLLYTDLANPTSNGVYQRIGFTPVLDATELTFDTP